VEAAREGPNPPHIKAGEPRPTQRAQTSPNRQGSSTSGLVGTLEGFASRHPTDTKNGNATHGTAACTSRPEAIHAPRHDRTRARE